MKKVADNRPVPPMLSIPTLLCAASALVSIAGLLGLATLAVAPAWHSLPWYAVVAFGLSAPLGFGGYVLGLMLRQHEARGTADDLPAAVPLAVELLAVAGVAGMFAGAACLTTFLLFAGNARSNSWPLYAYAIVFLALGIGLFLARAKPGEPSDDEDDDERRTGYASTVQLVTDNTGRSRARAKAVVHSRIRIHADEIEMRDWSRRYGCTPDQLRAAIAAVGTIASDVEAYLGKSR